MLLHARRMSAAAPHLTCGHYLCTETEVSGDGRRQGPCGTTAHCAHSVIMEAGSRLWWYQ